MHAVCQFSEVAEMLALTVDVRVKVRGFALAACMHTQQRANRVHLRSHSGFDVVAYRRHEQIGSRAGPRADVESRTHDARFDQGHFVDCVAQGS